MAVGTTLSESIPSASTRLALLGSAPIGDRHIWWNFVASSQAGIERAKRDWKEGRFPEVPGDEVELSSSHPGSEVPSHSADGADAAAERSGLPAQCVSKREAPKFTNSARIATMPNRNATAPCATTVRRRSFPSHVRRTPESRQDILTAFSPWRRHSVPSRTFRFVLPFATAIVHALDRPTACAVKRRTMHFAAVCLGSAAPPHSCKSAAHIKRNR